MSSGECVAEADIVYVGGTGASDGAGCGTVAVPCASIKFGLTQLSGSRQTVVVESGSYGEQLDISSGTVTIVGRGDVTVDPNLTIAEQGIFKLSGDADVRLSNLVLAPNSTTNETFGVHCNSATAAVGLDGVEVSGVQGGILSVGVFSDQCDVIILGSTIKGGTGLGLSVTGGSVTLERSEVSGNAGGGMTIDGASFSIVDNFIVNNGSDGADGSPEGGVSLLNTDGLGEAFAFNTLYGNGIDDGADGYSSLKCSNTSLVASSNIIVTGGQGGGNGSVSSLCTIHYSLIEGASVFPGDFNITGDPKFVDAGDGDYHIQAGSACIDKADPSSPPMVDYDGEERPMGSAPDIGADEAG
jgi:hypothetical protein